MTYFDRLVDCGMCKDYASVLVADFLTDGDALGLEDYCRELERIKAIRDNVAKVPAKSAR